MKVRELYELLGNAPNPDAMVFVECPTTEGSWTIKGISEVKGDPETLDPPSQIVIRIGKLSGPWVPD